MSIERDREKYAKSIRAAIRLKHSLAADDEIAAVLPEKMAEFDAQIMRGKRPKAVEIAGVTVDGS